MEGWVFTVWIAEESIFKVRLSSENLSHSTAEINLACCWYSASKNRMMKKTVHLSNWNCMMIWYWNIITLVKKAWGHSGKILSRQETAGFILPLICKKTVICNIHYKNGCSVSIGGLTREERKTTENYITFEVCYLMSLRWNPSPSSSYCPSWRYNFESIFLILMWNHWES